jgi:hypothetical protein
LPGSAFVRAAVAIPLSLVVATAGMTSGCGFIIFNSNLTKRAVVVEEPADSVDDVELNSEPLGADINLDGAPAGKTPTTLRLSYQTQIRRKNQRACWSALPLMLLDAAVVGAAIGAGSYYRSRKAPISSPIFYTTLALVGGGSATLFPFFGIMGLGCPGDNERESEVMIIRRDHVVTLASGGWKERLAITAPHRVDQKVNYLFYGLDRAEWDRAKEQNTGVAYQEYVKKYRSGRWRNDARNAMARIEESRKEEEIRWVKEQQRIGEEKRKKESERAEAWSKRDKDLTALPREYKGDPAGVLAYVQELTPEEVLGHSYTLASALRDCGVSNKDIAGVFRRAVQTRPLDSGAGKRPLVFEVWDALQHANVPREDIAGVLKYIEKPWPPVDAFNWLLFAPYLDTAPPPRLVSEFVNRMRSSKHAFGVVAEDDFPALVAALLRAGLSPSSIAEMIAKNMRSQPGGHALITMSPHDITVYAHDGERVVITNGAWRKALREAGASERAVDGITKTLDAIGAGIPVVPSRP